MSHCCTPWHASTSRRLHLECHHSTSAPALWSGESVGRGGRLQPVAEIVPEIADEAETPLRRWDTPTSSSQRATGDGDDSDDDRGETESTDDRTGQNGGDRRRHAERLRGGEWDVRPCRGRHLRNPAS